MEIFLALFPWDRLFFSGPSGENTPKKRKKVTKETHQATQGAHSRLSARKIGRLAQQALACSQSHPHIGPCTETSGGYGATTVDDWPIFFLSPGDPRKPSQCVCNYRTEKEETGSELQEEILVWVLWILRSSYTEDIRIQLRKEKSSRN